MERSSISIFALLAVVALASAIALAMPAHAQQASEVQQASEAGSDNLTAMPVSFVLDNMMDVQAQDIKESIFEYKLQAAKNDPNRQAKLIKQRSDELRNATTTKESLLRMLLKENGTISTRQRSGMANETSVSLKKYDAWSKNLAEQAAGLTMLNDSGAYTQSVIPLIDNISDAQDLAAQVAQGEKDKNNKNTRGKSDPAPK